MYRMKTLSFVFLLYIYLRIKLTTCTQVQIKQLPHLYKQLLCYKLVNFVEEFVIRF